MRNKFFFALTLVSLVVFAQLADSVKWELSYRNSVVNGGFEQGKQGFSSTGNSTFRQITNTSLVGSGKASGYIDFTAASEKLRSDLFTIPNALKGRTCLAKFIYNGGGGADIRYWIENQSGTVVAGYGFSGSTNEVITSATTNYTDSRDINFTCPTSGSLRFVLEGQGNANALYVDDFYIGRPFTYIATDALGGSGNDFTYGDGLATNKRLTWNRGSNNPQIRWNESTSRLEYSNNGSNFAAIGSGGQFANYTNILENPSFEDGIANYSVTGSASLTQSSTNPAFGTYKAIVDFSAAGEFFRNTTQTIPQGLYGENCLVRFRYQGGGTADIYYRVTDGTNTLAGYTATSTQFKISAAASTWTDSLDLTFPCPSSGGLRLELESAGNAAALSVDDIYIGENFKVGTVAQAEYVGGIEQAGASGCAYSQNTSSGLTNYITLGSGTGCNAWTAEGAVTATGTNSHSAVIANPKPGYYMVVVTGLFNQSATNTCSFRLSDGTTTYQPQAISVNSTGGVNNLTFHVSYTTGQSSKTFSLQSSDDHAGSCALQNGNAGVSASWKFYRFPLSSEVAVSANVPYQGGTLTYAGATNCFWSTTSSSYTTLTADTDCSTPTASGNLSAPGTKIPAAVAASLEAGSYAVLISGLYSMNTSGTACFAEVFDGTNSSGFSNMYAGSSTIDTPLALMGVFNYTTKQSNLTFQVRMKRQSGAGTCAIYNDVADSRFQIQLIPLSPSVSMPNLVGSVTSNTTGSERIERIRFGGVGGANTNCTSSPCTIQGQSGSWVTSVTRNSAGNYTINFTSGIFASAPVCLCSSVMNGVSGNSVCGNQAASTSSITTDNRLGSTGVATDAEVSVMCMGPRP